MWTGQFDPRERTPWVDMEDTFSWGAEGCGGVAVGLALGVHRVEGGQPVPYRIAIANRSQEPKGVVLCNGTDLTYRTRISIAHAGVAETRPAVNFPRPTTSNVEIVVSLAPGEVHQREGFPLMAGTAWPGRRMLQIVYGGTGEQRCEVRCGAAAAKNSSVARGRYFIRPTVPRSGRGKRSTNRSSRCGALLPAPCSHRPYPVKFFTQRMVARAGLRIRPAGPS